MTKNIFIKSTHDLEKSILHCQELGLENVVKWSVDTTATFNKITYIMQFDSEADANLFKVSHPYFK